MTFSDIAAFRLHSQQITSSNFKTVKELVGWMGAIQAQEYHQAKWAIGARLPHLTDAEIEQAFIQGDIIRTHAMRPTWHFVSADDIYWMLQLTARQIKSAMKARNRDLGLTEVVLRKSQEVMMTVLAGNRSLTRDDLNTQLNLAGIKTDEQRSYHILMEAEIDGVICSAGILGKKQSYGLLEEIVTVKKKIEQDEALALLAKKYFTSHGPATLPDFVWWSGLPVSDARKALELNKPNLISEVVGSETYWFSDSIRWSPSLPDSAYLLPAFDEYLVSYKNRNAAIASEDHKKAISSNGIFRPVIVINGQVTGLWKRILKKDNVSIESDLFRIHNDEEQQLIRLATEKYGQFLKKEIR